MCKKALQLKQLNGKMLSFASIQKVAAQPTGWLKAISLALGIPSEQVGKKL